MESAAEGAEELEEDRNPYDDPDSWEYRQKQKKSSRYDKDWRKKKKADQDAVAKAIRSRKSEGLEEDCPPAELPAQGMEAAEPETLTADDITDLQNLLDKLSNTLTDEPGMELAGGEAPSEEEAPIVMRQEEELREIVRGVITRLREKKIVR